jgi:hypothetical protein
MANKNPKPLPEGYDPELEKANKGYEKYESEQKEKQKKLDSRDEAMRERFRSVKESVKKVLPFKKGGVTRADGCIKKGHTKGRIV